jgi:hypothetical protein
MIIAGRGDRFDGTWPEPQIGKKSSREGRTGVRLWSEKGERMMVMWYSDPAHHSCRYGGSGLSRPIADQLLKHPPAFFPNKRSPFIKSYALTPDIQST